MNCPYCAEIIPDDIRFCPRCGTEMGSPLPDSPAYRGPLPPGFEPPTSGKAIGSLICGIFCFFLPASLIAVILGHLSLSEIRKSAGRLKGQGLATTGLILGYFGIALVPFFLIIAAVAIPNFLRARMAANEASAVGSLRTLNTAAIRYALQCPDFGFPASAENLGPGSGDCAHANLLEPPLTLPQSVIHGYMFLYQPKFHDWEGHITKYAISADPLQPGVSGNRHFYTDETGIIRVEIKNGANSLSPPL